MTEALQFAILGLGAGAIYALLGHGLVLCFRGSGVINLAHGAFAMAGAYVFYELHAVRGMTTALALALTVGVLAIIGAIVDQLLLRRLRDASTVVRVIATLGVLLIVQAIGILRYGVQPTLVEPLLAQSPVDLLGTTVSSDRLWLLAIAVVATGALTAFVHRTRVGWALTAVSENPESLASLGWSAERMSTLTWAVGAGLAAAAGALIAPITQLAVTNLTLLVIPALAAALFGGFRSFPLTLAGGLLLGVGEAETQNYVDLVGASTAVPFLVIAATVMARGTTLPSRGHITERLPSVGTGEVSPRVVVIVGAAAAIFLWFGASDDLLASTIILLTTSIVLLSIVVVTGFSGQLSLAQFALSGIGALLAARMVHDHQAPFVLAVVLGTLGTAVAGVLFALPALRSRGVELAVITLGLGLASEALLFRNVDVTTSAGGTDIGDPRLFGLDVTSAVHPARYALLTLIVFIAAALVVCNIRRGRSGRRMLAIRANERAAASLGIDVFTAKFHAFAVGGALAGLGGVLLAFRSSNVVYTEYGPLSSITGVAQVVIGGVGTVIGAVTGAVLAPGSVGQQLSGSDPTDAARYLPLLSGIILLLLLVAAPDGLVPAARRRLPSRLRRWGARPAGAPVTEAVVERVAPQPLSVQGLRVRYGGVVAVDGLSFEVGAGEVVGLIGPNGAGKTSVIDALSGFTRSSGAVRLGGQDISRWGATRRARSGLVRSFQSLELFEDMTVRENLLTAGDLRDHRAMFTDLVRPGAARLTSPAVAAVREFELADLLDRRPTDLSYGQRRLVAIARAVASAPSVLLLDEPAAGLNEHESRELAALIRRLADDWGVGIVLIEHDMEVVMSISDRVHAIEFGRPIAEGTPAEVRDNPAAIAAYLGA